MKKWCGLAAGALLFVSQLVKAHPQPTDEDSLATYLGNAAVLVTSGKQKVLFDPFFPNNFGYYQLVPKHLRTAVFAATPPFDNITAVFVSHSHADHFAAGDTLRYLNTYPEVVLIAPKQAIEQVAALNGAKKVVYRMFPVDLAFGDGPWKKTIAGLTVDAVRIPHAGWPGRAEVQNMVFRVSFNTEATVMHLGDADPDVEHYLPFRSHWQSRETGLAFPPYWFFESLEGRDILDSYLNVKQQVGVHVPLAVPRLLIKSGRDYFSKPSESRHFH